MTHHAPVSDATDHELELRGSGRWRQNYQVAYIVSFADVFFLNVTWNIWNIRKSYVVSFPNAPSHDLSPTHRWSSTMLSFSKCKQCSSCLRFALQTWILICWNLWKATKIQPKQCFLWSLSSLQMQNSFKSPIGHNTITNPFLSKYASTQHRVPPNVQIYLCKP